MDMVNLKSGFSKLALATVLTVSVAGCSDDLAANPQGVVDEPEFGCKTKTESNGDVVVAEDCSLRSDGSGGFYFTPADP